MVLIAGFIILLFVIYLVRRYRNMQKKMSDELNKVNRNYVLTFQNMEKARQELSILQENIDLSVKKNKKKSRLCKLLFKNIRRNVTNIIR